MFCQDFIVFFINCPLSVLETDTNFFQKDVFNCLVPTRDIFKKPIVSTQLFVKGGLKIKIVKKWMSKVEVKRFQ